MRAVCKLLPDGRIAPAVELRFQARRPMESAARIRGSAVLQPTNVVTGVTLRSVVDASVDPVRTTARWFGQQAPTILANRYPTTWTLDHRYRPGGA